MALDLRRERRTKKRIIPARSPRPTTAAATPIPALAPELRPEEQLPLAAQLVGELGCAELAALERLVGEDDVAVAEVDLEAREVEDGDDDALVNDAAPNVEEMCCNDSGAGASKVSSLGSAQSKLPDP